MPRKQAKPLGQIDLLVTYGDLSNFTIETLTVEVVGFHGTCHAILGRPCYTKFMSVPNYTVGTSFQRAYECDVECCELATVTIACKELTAIKERTVEEAPDSKRSAGSFEPTEGTKEVLIDPSSSEGKVVCISTSLSLK
jgi:hypothetical protein